MTQKGKRIGCNEPDHGQRAGRRLHYRQDAKYHRRKSGENQKTIALNLPSHLIATRISNTPVEIASMGI